MAFTIRDKNGNGYTSITDKNKTEVYISLKCASEVLKDLPKGYSIQDETTKKKVVSL
jgi:hypothetical protein